MADRILVPVTPSQADVWSTQRFLNIVVDTLRGKTPKIVAFINRADTHASVRESDETEEVLASLPGITLLRKRLCQRTAFRRSFSEGRAVFEMGSSGKAAATEFRQFVKALFGDATEQRVKRQKPTNTTVIPKSTSSISESALR